MIPYHRDSLSTKSLYNKIATPRSQRRPVIRRSPYSQSQIHPHSLGIGPCAKAASVQSGYLPDIDVTLAEKKGICFDYAALMAAMLRSQNVPVKLVVGWTGSQYHAWINVWSESDGWVEGMIYFNGQNWELMDPTFASSGNQSNKIMEYIGNGANYKAKYLY